MQIILIWTNNEVFVYTKQRVRMHKLNTHVLAWAAVGDNLGENQNILATIQNVICVYEHIGFDLIQDQF